MGNCKSQEAENQARSNVSIVYGYTGTDLRFLVYHHHPEEKSSADICRWSGQVLSPKRSQARVARSCCKGQYDETLLNAGPDIILVGRAIHITGGDQCQGQSRRPRREGSKGAPSRRLWPAESDDNRRYALMDTDTST